MFATHTEAVAALKKVTKRCSSDLKNLDREVSTILQELKKLNGNIGQAEGLIKEAKNQLVLNAGEIQKHGHIVKNVADCLRANDANFNKSFTAWNDQVNKWVKAQAKVEKNWQSAIKLYGPIDSLKKEMEQSECLLKDLINDSVAEARDFLALKARINNFHKNARTDDGDRTFESFRDFPTTVKSSKYKSYAAKELEKTLAKMKPADAHSYLMEEAAKYGFDERQLAKAIKLAEAHKKAMKNIANALNETENDPTKKAKLIENLTKIRDELISIDDRYKRGRRNQELADRLAADANKAYKKMVEAAMDLFTNSAATADQLVRSLT